MYEIDALGPFKILLDMSLVILNVPDCRVSPHA